MSNSDLKVTVSGGHANIGNINRGDHGHLETTQSTIFQAADLDTFEQSISNIAAHNNIDFAEYQALQSQVAELIKHPEKPGFFGAVETLCEKYKWALKPLSVLFAMFIKNN